MLSVGHTVTTSVGMCDIDIRPVRYSVLCNFIMHGFDWFKIFVVVKLKKNTLSYVLWNILNFLGNKNKIHLISLTSIFIALCF